jgi:cytochrome c biogenesis protein CcdA
LNDSDHLEEFLEIANLLVTQGVPILPPDFCTPCEMAKGLNWREIYIKYSIPLILVFKDERLTSIIVLRYDASTLDKALAYSDNATKVFLHYGDPVLLKEEAKMKIEELFKDRIKLQVGFFHILPFIIAAAFVDAINPCEFFILIVFLSLITMRLGRKAVLKFGVAFSVAIFAAYFMMGLGIWRLIGYVREAKIFVVILGLSLGLRSILNFIFGFFGLSIGLRETIGGFLNRRFKRVPKIFSEKVSERLRRFSSNPLSAFLIGVITSAFLLPCTSGPYLIALSLIADIETQIQGLILLTIYNSIFITPFLALTVGMYMLKIKTSELKRWSSNKQRWLNLAGGLLMIALSIYLITYAI